MVSSIRQQEIDELKAQKKTDRENEIEAFAQAEATVLASKKASDERIAKKLAIIEAGGIVPNPKPVVIDEPVVIEEPVVNLQNVATPKKKVSKKKVSKKKVSKKKK
tara:strand:+ start:1735 stop:2052 length:318 start_codon:yes stop_codon:yes gene_type:complete